jgi:hypothetical protein
MELESIMECSVDPSEYFNIFLEVKYGHTKLPRYLNLNYALAQFMGFYVSQGSIRTTNKKAEVFLSAKDIEVQGEMVESVVNGLHVQPRQSPSGVAITSYLMALFVKYILKCGIDALSKEIPDILYTSPTEKKTGFLKTYFIGAGYGDVDRIVLSTISRKLAGYWSNISNATARNKKNCGSKGGAPQSPPRQFYV